MTLSTVHLEVFATNEADHTVNVCYWTDRLGIDMLGCVRNAEGKITEARTGVTIGLLPAMVLPKPGEQPSQEVIDFLLKWAQRDWFTTLEAKLDGGVDAITPMLGAVGSLQDLAVREVQFRMDAWARTRGYDDIKSAASYAGDEDPTFNAEGTRAKRVKSRTWRALYALEAAVQAGQQPPPTTLEDIIAVLPAMQWPDQDAAAA